MNDHVDVSIDVPWEPAEAFQRFATRLGDWWPREYTWSGDALVSIGIEPGQGGLCMEHGPHGFRGDWGRVLAWEPPALLRLAWQIGPHREPVPDSARASIVEVRFAAAPAGGSRVTLEHSGFDRHGNGADEYRVAMASPQGWPYILDRYATADLAPRADAALEARSLEASLTVRDLATSVAWYRDVLGVTVEREYRREERLFAVALRAGKVELLLGQDDGAKGADRVRGEGFSLQLTTGEDIDALAARIQARGGTLDTPPFEVAGKRAFRLRDPDGFRFTISSPRVS